MDFVYQILPIAFFVYSLSSFIMSVKNRKRPFGLTPIFNPIGSFVWVDNFVFGLFFSVVSLFTLFTNNWDLFWLTFSVFWVVRSIGEQIYWFLEQFAVRHRNAPKTLWPYRFFKGEEVWIVMQIFWQCVTVVSIISSVYFFSRWLR